MTLIVVLLVIATLMIPVKPNTVGTLAVVDDEAEGIKITPPEPTPRIAPDTGLERVTDF